MIDTPVEKVRDVKGVALNASVYIMLSGGDFSSKTGSGALR